MTLFLRPTLLALALGGITWGAQAQALPNIGNALHEAQPPALPQAQPAPLPAVGGVAIEPPMQALPGGTSLQVTEFAIVGNRVIDSATLLALVNPDAGKRLGLAELDAIATRITRYYRAQGYFVARAYVPAQEIQGGRVVLRVVEGNYGDFHLKNHSLVSDAKVQGLLDDIKDRDIVSLDTLERAMLIINDTPGVKVVQADVMPGARVGTSDFVIGTEATPRYDGYAMLDNYGSNYTGRQRLSFGGDWNSPSGRGDRLSLAGLATNDSGLFNGRLDYSALLATNGTRGDVALSHTRYRLGGTYAALDAHGSADELDFASTTPLRRTRARSIDLGFNAGTKNLVDEVDSTATRTGRAAQTIGASLGARVEHELLGSDGLTQARAALTLGRLHFSDATAAALDAAGADTQGLYGKLNLQLSRTSLLPRQFSLTLSAQAQINLRRKNLDGSERMSISGDGGVTAYPGGEASGDSAQLLHVELNRAVAAGAATLNLGAFADWGHASVVTAQSGVAPSRTLGDVGLALNAQFAQGAFVKLRLAHRTSGGAPTSEPRPDTVVLAQAGWVF